MGGVHPRKAPGRRFAIGAAVVVVGLLAAAAVWGAAVSRDGAPRDTAQQATPVGEWHTDSGPPGSLTFDADGSMQGDDGCNGMGGTWSRAADGTIVFDELAMTLKACPGDGSWVNLGASASVVGDRMTLRDAEGAELGTLSRKDAASGIAADAAGEWILPDHPRCVWPSRRTAPSPSPMAA